MAEVGFKSFDFTTIISITTFFFLMFHGNISPLPPAHLLNAGSALQWPWVQIQHNALFTVQQPAIVRLRQMH
jgi:hypothetical protein